ncbi:MULTISPECIES: hypothetical protein [Pseudomonas]|uniref:hypothetical protein n=1 Tax=Pseudomonas TaxID=286 RepID=UPI0018A8EB6D|nr:MULTISPECIES: hypothetical protein [Pseudomonas]MBF8746350.1 hypothetical protein [Pseudomonas monteilii]MCT8167117.1 hypothetical protein [Pseudomonas sp. HD6422]MCT8185856.1 hypothetical protein [Pseudomonas sp. HD6421]
MHLFGARLVARLDEIGKACVVLLGFVVDWVKVLSVSAGLLPWIGATWVGNAPRGGKIDCRIKQGPYQRLQ